MSSASTGRPLLAALLAAALTAAAGCGGDAAKPAAATVKHDRFTYARGLFNEICAGCHTLVDAGARGRRFDLEESGLVTILDTVPQRIALARAAILGGEEDIHDAGVDMPAYTGVLSHKEVEALADYVGTVVGRGKER